MAKQVQLRRGDAAANSVFVGAVGEVTMDTTHSDLRVHDGTTVGGFRVPTLVDAQYPTADNNYTWYRKWSDGWVEQGGYVAGEGDSLLKTISLPVTMANSNYTVVSTPVSTSTVTPSSDKYPSVQQLSTTSFKLYVWSNISKTWQVSGMAA